MKFRFRFRFRFRLRHLCAALSVIVLNISSFANAAVVHWTLDGVTLSDGQSLTGSFDYDREINQYSNISITNSGTAAWGATTFTHIAADQGSWLGASFDDGSPAVGDIMLTLSWNINDQELTNAGGILVLRQDNPNFSLCGYSNCSAPLVRAGDVVNVTAGQLTSVPVPAAIWLFGSGLVGLTGLARHKKRTI